MMNYRVEVLKNSEGLIAWGNEWLAFEENIINLKFTFSYYYILTFWQNFSKGKKDELGIARELLVIFLYKNGVLIAIYPFCKIIRKRKKFLKVTSIEFIGQQMGATYSDIITNGIDNEAHQFVLNWLYATEQFDLVSLNHIPEFSPNKNTIFYQHVYPETYSSVAFFTSSQNYDEYKKIYYPKKIIEMLNLCNNRIRKSGYRFNFINKEMEENDFEELKRLSDFKHNKKNHIENNYSTIYKNEFIRKLYSHFKSKVSYLQINDSNIAFLTSIYFKNHVYFYDTAYDTNFKQISPGILLFDECIRQNITNVISYIDFGWGIDFFKFRLCNRFIKLFTALLPGNKLFSSYWYNELDNIYKSQMKDFENSTNYLKSVTKHLKRINIL